MIAGNCVAASPPGLSTVQPAKRLASLKSHLLILFITKYQNCPCPIMPHPTVYGKQEPEGSRVASCRRDSARRRTTAALTARRQQSQQFLFTDRVWWSTAHTELSTDAALEVAVRPRWKKLKRGRNSARSAMAERRATMSSDRSAGPSRVSSSAVGGGGSGGSGGASGGAAGAGALAVARERSVAFIDGRCDARGPRGRPRPRRRAGLPGALTIPNTACWRATGSAGCG